MIRLTEDEIRAIKEIRDYCNDEDTAVRERQIRVWRRLKLLWEGYSNIWFDEVAHDWRVWDFQDSMGEGDDTDQAYYDRPVNVFRAYLESIIAALSVLVPPVKCYPDDADNTLDLATAKAGDKIAKLIYRHNKADLVWLHALFIYCTEGMTACYGHTVKSNKFGMYEEKEYEDLEERHKITYCPMCNSILNDETDDAAFDANPELQAAQSKLGEELDRFAPGDEDAFLQHELLYGNDMEELCPVCQAQMLPQVTEESLIVTRLVGVSSLPKARIKLEVYGGLNVKVPNYARTQDDCPYLSFRREVNYVDVLFKYDRLKGKTIRDLKQAIKASPGEVSGYEQYDQWGRLSPQYQGEWPLNVVTVEHIWLRPSSYYFLNNQDDMIKTLTKKFPNGICATFVNDHFAEATNDALDDAWTINYNPLSDYIHFNPLGLLLTSVQDITNDLISLILQTIEHGISQTFADPNVLSFKQYKQIETVPGSIVAATPKTGKALSDGFHELKTATLSAEVMPFQEYIQSMGQLASGATPSIFGGQLQGAGGDTASGYSMSKAQALQRLQNTWKMYTSWWADIFGKAIPLYIKEVKDDERDVSLDNDGNFVNILIRKAELEGKIGRVELEANENLPLNFSQKRDLIKELMMATNPEMMAFLNAPENKAIIHSYLGLDELYMPGEDDIIKQYDEIRELLKTEPIPAPMMPGMGMEPGMEGDPNAGMGDPNAEAMAQDPAMVESPEMQETSSVDIDPDFDNHKIEFEICRKWIISAAGRDAKVTNPRGFLNVMLHAKQHLQIMQQQMMQEAMMQANGEGGSDKTPNEKPNPKKKDAPITGESDVTTQ